MSQLIFYINKGYPTVQDLADKEITIGRGKDNHVVLKEASASAYHAKIVPDESGGFVLEDLDSQNGTFINQEKIKKEKLHDGDSVKFGSVKALFLDQADKMSRNLEQEVEGLMRKSKIERNNLRLIEGDAKTAQAAAKRAAEAKQSLDAEIEKSTRHLEKLVTDVKEHQKKADKLSKQISDAELFRRNAEKLEAEFKKREAACRELSDKILAGEKLYADLDLENAVREKKDLTRELEELNQKLESSSKAINDNETELAEAEATFKKARQTKVEITELESKRAKRQTELDSLKQKIADDRKTLADLDLENSIRKKQDLDQQVEQLNQQVEASESKLKENQKAADEAAVVFEKAKQVEAEIIEQESLLTEKSKERKKLESEIAEQNQLESELKTKNETSRKELDQQLETIATRRSEIEALDKEIKQSSEKLQASEKQLESISTSVKEAKSHIKTSMATRDSLVAESLALTRVVGEKSQVLQRLRQRSFSRDTTGSSSCPPIRLVNPWMSSLVQYFHKGAASPGEEKIDPIGYPAYAACTRGSMHRDGDSILSTDDPVLVLLSGDIENDRAWIASLSEGRPDGILLTCWPEDRLQAGVAGQIADIVSGVSGIVSSDTRTADLIAAQKLDVPQLQLPIPCPVDFADWDFSIPVNDREADLFINGDRFNAQSPLHEIQLKLINQVARKGDCQITFYQSEEQSIAGLDLPEGNVDRVIEALTYSDYLRQIANHRMIAGFGINAFGGPVSCDAVLTHSILCGADGSDSTEELLFSDTAILPENISDKAGQTAQLLTDRNLYLEAMERSQGMATQLISYEAVRDRLAEFLDSLR